MLLYQAVQNYKHYYYPVISKLTRSTEGPNLKRSYLTRLGRFWLLAKRRSDELSKFRCFGDGKSPAAVEFVSTGVTGRLYNV